MLTDGTADRPRRTGLAILVFLLVSAAAAPLLALVQTSSGLDPEVLQLTTFSTAVGALAVVLFWRRRLPLPAVTVTGLRRPVLTAIAAVLIYAGLLTILGGFPNATWPPFAGTATGVPVAVVLGLQVVGAAGEEVGWRGLVQPLLETRFRLLTAGLITGLLFGVGHVVVLFALGPAVFGVFLVAAVCLSLLLALLTWGRSLGARVILATVVHWLVNLVSLLLFSDGDGSLRWTLITAAAILPVGAVSGWQLHRLDRLRVSSPT